MLRLFSTLKNLRPSMTSHVMGPGFHTTSKQLGGGDAEFIVGFRKFFLYTLG
ncbi:hypothetical protein BpHYR1_049447 [Brachionus plicatilis]|uniref:Uncharacterized protein n=1 Tax=Brachionus plicatilis TaxID=10195 RepID=A0A3M7SBA6_BRAPC|nr:hypothetical protein BpHYR1_049447 [Brachionus plicatilis]